ncbi:efflux transporter outer membrane subunit [Cronobacter sakazakii]|nr:efflux transporter outer membrane subunit [Cronobacter sakazakii]ELY3834473.1 efflux transporter outer membrane subunit [Cronobacter sakazakii]ELY5957549.1 efflux transporter outer membrane subunit [Cronobacter sakazakii]
MEGLDRNTPRAKMLTTTAVGTVSDASCRWPSPHWWERYRDPELNSLMDLALSLSPDVRLARARLEQAAAIAEQAGAQRWPTISTDADAVRKRFAQAYDAAPPLAGNFGTTYKLSADVQYTFDFWGGQRAALRAALGETAARDAEVGAARLMLTSRIASAWFELSHLFAMRDLAQQSLELRRQTLQLVERRVRAGLDTEVERKQAQGDLPVTERDILQLDEMIALQRHALSTLAGLPLGALENARPELMTTAADGELPDSIPAELLGHRPDVVAARWRVEAARQHAEVARADFYPNISLRVFAGFARTGLTVGLSDWLAVGSRTYGVAPAISLPIFDAGRLRAQYKGRAAELDAAIESYNSALLNAVRDVADRLVSFDALLPQINAQTQALAARQAAFDLARRQYESGLTDYLTVLNAQNALLYERRGQLTLKKRALVLDAELNRALGGGFNATEATSNILWK